MLGLKTIFEAKGFAHQQENILALLYLSGCFKPVALIDDMKAAEFDVKTINQCAEKVLRKTISNFSEILDETLTENVEWLRKTERWLSIALERILNDKTWQENAGDDLRKLAERFADLESIPKHKEYDAILVLGESKDEILQSKRLDVVSNKLLVVKNLLFLISDDQLSEKAQLTSLEEAACENWELYRKLHKLNLEPSYYHSATVANNIMQFLERSNIAKRFAHYSLASNQYLKIFHELAQTQRLLIISSQASFNTNFNLINKIFAKHSLKLPEMICHISAELSKEDLFKKMKDNFILPKLELKIVVEPPTFIEDSEEEIEQTESNPQQKPQKKEDSFWRSNSMVYGTAAGLVLAYSLFNNSKHVDGNKILTNFFSFNMK